MRKLGRMVAGAVVLVVVASVVVPQAFALGFRNPDQDARATGQGEAFVAQADDASAIYYNPAGLTQLRGTEVTGGAYVLFPHNRLQGAGSGGEMNTLAFLPHFYAATDFGEAKSPWRFGLGANVPFGEQVRYAENGPFRYLVTNAKLAVFNIQPTVAYQINEHLSLGVGLNIYDGDTALNRHVAFAPFPDGHIHFDGNGVAFGATAGLMWKITSQHTIGVVYRSPFAIDFEGNGVLKTPIGTQAGASHATIQFPQSAAAGYAFRPTKKLKLEVDVEWTNWDTLNKLVLHAPGTSFDGTTIPFNWQDSLFYELGAQYELNDHWTVRSGYIYSENTVPNSTFSPSVPDSNRHVFSVGLGYGTKRIAIDLVYQYSLSADRTLNATPARIANGLSPTSDGNWKSDGHALMITSTMKF